MTTLVKKVFFLLIAAVLLGQTAFAQTREEGMAAMQMEKWDKAISTFSALTKAKADDQDAWLSLSNAYLAKGDKDKALAVLNEGFTAKPEGALAFVINSRILLLQNKPAEAEEQFKRAASKGKKDIVTLRQIGESFLFYVAPGDRKANLTRAAELLKNAYDYNGKDVPTLMAIGYAYREQGNGGEAARYYDFASQFQPKNPLPPYMLATVYKAAKLDQKFLDNLNTAIALDNSYTPALRAKAEYYYFKRKFNEAKEAYNMLITNGKEVMIEDEMQYANTLFLTKDYKGCTELVEKIIAKDGSKNYLRRLLGYSYYENGDYVKGQAIMDDYFKMVTPEKILASDYTYQGRLLLKGKNDTLGAITNLAKAIEKDTSEWGLNEEIGNLYYQRKDYCGAAKHYQIWLDSLRSEGKSISHYRLGFCYYFCKTDSLRYQHALTSFKKVTEMTPAAGIGWLWSGKAASKLEVDVQTDTSAANIAKFGVAKPYYDKYIEIAGVDPVKNKKDLIAAYEYVSYYHFLRKEDAQARTFIGKLLELDPANATGVGLKGVLDGTPPPAGGAPAPGGSGGAPK